VHARLSVACISEQLTRACSASFTAASKLRFDEPLTRRAGWTIMGSALTSQSGPTDEQLSAAWEALIYARGARRFLLEPDPASTRLAA
jgi:hypothetical protein